MKFAAAGGGAIKIGAVVAASSILAGAGMIEVFAARGGATKAPASFDSGDVEGDGICVAVNREVEVKVGTAGAGGGALVAAIAILGAATVGASAGSWIWPSLIWETMFARAKGSSASMR